jgi:hypothetical protein
LSGVTETKALDFKSSLVNVTRFTDRQIHFGHFFFFFLFFDCNFYLIFLFDYIFTFFLLLWALILLYLFPSTLWGSLLCRLPPQRQPSVRSAPLSAGGISKNNPRIGQVISRKSVRCVGGDVALSSLLSSLRVLFTMGRC